MARLNDGFKTLIAFSLAPSIKLYEKTLTPPSLEAGGENDTTTMRNTRWRTRQPKKLITAGNMSGTAAYDPVIYTDIVSIIGVNQLITVTFSDGSTLQVWGWLDAFTPNEITEGAQPTAAYTIILSNEDATPAEIAPAYAAP